MILKSRTRRTQFFSADLHSTWYRLTNSEQIRHGNPCGEGTCFRGQTRPYSKGPGLCAPQFWVLPTYAYTLWSWMTEFGVVTQAEGRALMGQPPVGIVHKCVARSVDDSWVLIELTFSMKLSTTSVLCTRRTFHWKCWHIFQSSSEVSNSGNMSLLASVDIRILATFRAVLDVIPVYMRVLFLLCRTEWVFTGHWVRRRTVNLIQLKHAAGRRATAVRCRPTDRQRDDSGRQLDVMPPLCRVCRHHCRRIIKL